MHFDFIRAHQLVILRCDVSNAYGLVFIITLRGYWRVLCLRKFKIFDDVNKIYEFFSSNSHG